MSFKADFEIFLHLEEFINIDLPSQGLFRLTASVYQELEEMSSRKKCNGIPFEFSTQASRPNPNPRKLFFPAQYSATIFQSKVGSVRFSDERIVLDDYVRFKLQVQSFPRLHSENIYLQVDLIFMPCYHSSSVKAFEGQKVATSKFRLETIEHGLLNYYQGIFADDHSSRFTFTLFACLANFKFGKYWLKGEEERLLKIGENFAEQKLNQSPEQRQGVRQASPKQKRRAEVQNFDQFLEWINSFYKNKIMNPKQYFYNTYVKNLRYYFYLSQSKVNQKSLLSRKVILKVPKHFLELPQSDKISQSVQNSQIFQANESVFKKYMSSYEPMEITSMGIQLQINQIYLDIFQFLVEMEKQFVLQQLSSAYMKREYNTYIKERYGQRVFKSIVYGDNHAKKSDENQSIAKKMRQKQSTTSTAAYPIEDLSFSSQKALLEFVFYEVCYPANEKPQLRFTKMEGKEEEKETIKRNTKKQSVNQQNKERLKEIEQNYLKNQIVEKIQQAKGEIGEKIDEEYQKVKPKIEQPADEMKAQPCFIGMEERSEFSSIANENQYPSDVSERGYGSEDFSLPSNEDNMVQNILQDITSDKSKFIDQDFKEIIYDEANMLVVMCHGFQGSQYDMLTTMRSLKEILPRANYLLSRANEENTEGDIEAMGERLSKEIKGYIHHYLDAEKVIINFIGHSMGGIIARSSLRHLNQQFSQRFGFFCSLSSPHLGYLNGVDNMIKAGLWVIRKFKPVQSLSQLSMEDHKNRRNTLIYRLSESGSLRNFRKIILLSSYQDSYVAWHSARILKHHSNKKNDNILMESQMVENILGNRPVHRIDVNFEVKEKNLDSFIGRTAHINLIVQESLFKIINATLNELFDITKQ